MTPFWKIFEILVNIFQGWLFAFFFSSIFEQKKNYRNIPYYFASVWVSSSALLTVLLFFPLSSPFLEPIPMVILILLLTQFFCSGPIAHRFFWTLAYFVMFMCALYLVLSIALSMPGVTSDFLFKSSYGRLLYVLTVNAFVTSLTFVLVRIAKRAIDTALKRRVIAVSTTLIVANLIVLLLLLEYASVMPSGLMSPIILLGSAVAIFVANMLVLWMFHHINEQNARVLQLSATEQRIAMQAKHQEEIGHIEQELRQFRHDIHSHFQFLMVCFKSRDYAKAEEYLRGLVTEFGALSKVIHTGNTEMDAILSVKAHIASRVSVDFDVEANLPAHLPVSDNDLVVIAGNILDNAIAACSGVAEAEARSVRVVSKIVNGTLLFKVMNAFAEEPKSTGIRWLIGKFKGKEHGQGLQIVASRVAKYGGYVDTKQDGQVFETTVIIPVA